jgi:16S rRNA (adenine1518-N6/adenine1519-N6)-dimethyltransferase
MKAKKSLGQNFLKSGSALGQIVAAGEIESEDIILEIGPGKGALTYELLKKAKMVLAVEKDRELFEFLKIKFEAEIKNNALVLVCGDILQFEIENYKLRNYKIIANIPYNVTGAILKKFLTAEIQPELMVLMVQQEVAQRIIARDGKESLLSISVKAYGEPKILMKVHKRYFSPMPKVDSAVIAIKNISREFFEKNKIQEGKFWEIVKAGFAHKRKKLSSNLKSSLGHSTAMGQAKNYKENPLILELGNKRAEDLSLSGWISLTE